MARHCGMKNLLIILGFNVTVAMYCCSCCVSDTCKNVSIIEETATSIFSNTIFNDVEFAMM
jgi:hypothetical protein